MAEVTATLVCPKCGGEMRSYERNAVTIDQCGTRRGIFLDRGELERLIDAELAYLQAAPAAAPGQPGPPPAIAKPAMVNPGTSSLDTSSPTAAAASTVGAAMAGTAAMRKAGASVASSANCSTDPQAGRHCEGCDSQTAGDASTVTSATRP